MLCAVLLKISVASGDGVPQAATESVVGVAHSFYPSLQNALVLQAHAISGPAKTAALVHTGGIKNPCPRGKVGGNGG
jgi:hypothetical protein